MTFADRLNYLIKRKGITGYRLSLDMDISESLIRAWRQKGVVPKDESILKLAKYFSVAPGWLRYGDQDQAPALRDDVMALAAKIEKFLERRPEELGKVKAVVEALVK